MNWYALRNLCGSIIRLKLFFIVLLMAENVSAVKIACSQQVNFDKILVVEIDSELGRKVTLFADQQSRAFVTIKTENFLELEAFIGQSEIRIYSSGRSTRPSEKVGLSIWSRDAIINWECSQADQSPRIEKLHSIYSVIPQ